MPVSINGTTGLITAGASSSGGGGVASNTALGGNALVANTSGTNNTALGNEALQANTTASNNTAVGYQAAYSSTTVQEITAVGYQALKASTAARTAAFGFIALTANTTGTRNSSFGPYSMATNTTGAFNSAFGDVALYSNTTGNNNTAIGLSALESNTTGSNNTAVGLEALKRNTTGSNNTAVGYNACFGNTTGFFNVGMGSSDGFYGAALQTNTTGAYNVAIGNGSLGSLNGSNLHTCVGFQAGAIITNGTGCTLIGYNTQPSVVSGDYQLVVATGGGATNGKGNSTGFINPNGGGVFQGNNSSTWSQVSDRRLKKNIVDNNTGLDLITAIKVRNFEYRLPEEVDKELSPNDAIKRTGIQLGVIAQEIAEVSSEFVKQETTGVLSVDSDNLTWYLINAVKELKAEIDQLKGAK